MVRTPACHAGGRRFESVLGRQREHSLFMTMFPKDASVAQSVEQRTENPCVVGSIPTGGTNAGVAHLVERHLAKVEVEGSSPFARSKYFHRFHLLIVSVISVSCLVATWPSGKARVCKTLTPRFKSGCRLQNIAPSTETNG